MGAVLDRLPYWRGPVGLGSVGLSDMSDDSRMVYRTERDEWRQRAVTAEAERDALLAARRGEVETPPESLVEVCARALWEAEGAHITPWPGKDGEDIDIYYDDARTVICSLIAQGWTPPGGTE